MATDAHAAAPKKSIWSVLVLILSTGAGLVIIFMVIPFLVSMVFQGANDSVSTLSSGISNLGNGLVGLAGSTSTLMSGFFILVVKILFIILGGVLAAYAVQQILKIGKGGGGGGN